MTPPPAATVAGRRVARESETEYVVTRTPRAGAVRQPDARPRTRERSQTREPARPATRPSGRATAAAAALEATLAPGAPSRTRRAIPAPARPRLEAPRPRPSGARWAPAPRLALRLQPPRLDRIVRGRAWIPVLGAMLVAIVGLRVAVLKLGASVGSQIQQATLLQSSNTMLRSQISALSDNQRIEKMAEAYGMHLPNPLDVHFVPASAGRRVNAAIVNISAPSNASFLSGLAAEQQNDQASTTQTSSLSALGPSGSTVSAATTTPTGSSTSGTAPSSTATATGSSPAASTTGASVSGSTTGSAVTAQTATGGASSSASTGSSTLATGGTSAPGGVSSTSATSATTATGAGSTGLNTGPTNTAAGGAATPGSAATTSTGGSGLAG